MKTRTRYEVYWPMSATAGVMWDGYADSSDDAMARALTELPASLQSLIVDKGKNIVPIVRELPQRERA